MLACESRNYMDKMEVGGLRAKRADFHFLTGFITDNTQINHQNYAETVLVRSERAKITFCAKHASFHRQKNVQPLSATTGTGP
jgi:hypothetical protein